MKTLTFEEARQALIAGNYVKSEYFTDDEYFFLNEQGKMEL